MNCSKIVNNFKKGGVFGGIWEKNRPPVNRVTGGRMETLFCEKQKLSIFGLLGLLLGLCDVEAVDAVELVVQLEKLGLELPLAGGAFDVCHVVTPLC